MMDVHDDGFCSLLDVETSKRRDDVKMPRGELGEKIRAVFEKDDNNGIMVTIRKTHSR